MQAIELKPGMRVRCIESTICSCALDAGTNEVVRSIDSNGWVEIERLPGDFFLPRRFKPIIRVKARGIFDTSYGC